MNMNNNRAKVLEEIRRILCLDQNCSPEHFRAEGIVVTEALEVEGRRRFPFRSHCLSIATMGQGVVISCSAPRLEWVKANLTRMKRDEVFSSPTISLLNSILKEQGQSMVGPNLKFACDENSLRSGERRSGVAIEVLDEKRVPDLYELAGFNNALGYHTQTERPDVLACVARVNGQIVGIAGASADCATMWQVGVDVVDSYRGRGIGRVLVGELTRAVLGVGRIPYYSAALSNVPSLALAVSVGYWPAWTEMYAI